MQSLCLFTVYVYGQFFFHLKRTVDLRTMTKLIFSDGVYKYYSPHLMRFRRVVFVVCCILVVVPYYDVLFKNTPFFCVSMVCPLRWHIFSVFSEHTYDVYFASYNTSIKQHVKETTRKTKQLHTTWNKRLSVIKYL